MPAYLVPSGAEPASAKVNIEAWTEETIESLRTVRISSANIVSPRIVRAPSAPLEILLDQEHPTTRPEGVARAEASATPQTTYKRREPLRRDSMNRREALLKGKEGSRRRQKWENGW